MTFARLPLAAFVLAVLVSSVMDPSAAYARQTLTEYETSGLSACGGKGEPTCPPDSTFAFSNEGVCDRGLKAQSGVCVEGTRRLTLPFQSESVGRKFARSWLGRALRLQQKDLGWTQSMSRMSWITAHNSFNNVADGYAFPNQYFSLTDLLDAGIRQFEWDVHSKEHPTTDSPGIVPALCHGTAAHFGCTYSDRDALNAIKELRDWLQEPGHDRDVVILQIEDRMDSKGIELFDSAVEEYLINEGIGIFDAAAFSAHYAAQPSPERVIGGAGLEFPSQQYLIDNNFRVVIFDGWLRRGLALQGFIQRTQEDWVNKTGKAYPDCEVDGQDLRPDSARIADAYGDFLTSPWTSQQVTDLTNCNVDSIKLDFLLDEGRPVTYPMLEATIWSWAKDQPPVNSTQVATMARATGRWSAASRTELRPFVCRATTRVTDSAYENTPVNDWQVTAATGPFAQGHAECAALGAKWSFAPPQTGYDNQKVLDLIGNSGVDPYVNFEGAGDDTWRISTRPELTGINVSGQPLSEVLLGFSVDAHNIEGLHLSWEFGDDSTSNAATPLHRYAKPGTYQVTARLKSTSDVELDAFNVLLSAGDGVNAIGGSGLTFSVPPGVTEGDQFTAVIRLSPSVNLLGNANCGPNAAVVSLTYQFAAGHQYDLVCRLESVNTGLETITASVRFDDGYVLTKTMDYFVVNRRPSVFGTFAEGTTAGPVMIPVTVTDAPGEKLTLIADWGDGTAPTTYADLDPGPTVISHHYTTAGDFNLTVTASDEEASGAAPIFVSVTPPHNGVPVITFTGPTDVRLDQVARYHYTAYDPDGGELLIGFFCGSLGEEVSRTASSFDCRFTQPIDGTLVFFSALDDENGAAGETITVRVRPAPALSLTALPPPNHPAGQPIDYPEGAGRAFEVKALTSHSQDATTLVSLMCGNQPSTPLTPDKHTGPSLAMEFACIFGDGPSTVEVAATVLDQYGTRTVRLPISVTNLPPVLMQVAGPPSAVRHGDGALVRATVIDPGRDTVHVAINWGDGTPATTHASINQSVINAEHVWTAPGEYTVTLTPTDKDGLSGAPVSIPVLVEGDTSPPTLTLNPPPVVIEATGPLTPVTIAGFATDDQDTDVAIVCDAPTFTFAVGSHTVTCRATDDDGNFDDESVSFTVQDTTPPAFDAPAVVAVDAVNAATVNVGFTVSASDLVSGNLVRVCVPESGSAFPIGTTDVRCTATDAAANPEEVRFPVIVTFVDTIRPAIVVSAPADVPAASPDGAVVHYSVSVTDAGTPGLTPVCSPVSGTRFPPGPTLIRCTATDAAQNTGEGFATVTVTTDAVPPLVTTPAPMTLPAASAAGAVATFTASATDNQQGSVGVTCAPASGTLFPIGTTTVRCSATDVFDNTGSASFTVTVTEVTTAGEMAGAGSLADDHARYQFEFVVREGARGGERARFHLRVNYNDGKKGKKSKKADGVFLARTTDFIAFSDDPNVTPRGRQRPPHVDTVLFSGAGAWNGRQGYSYEVQAVDEGQTSRRHREAIRMIVRAPDGSIVVSVDDEIDRGAIRSIRIRH